MIYQLQQLLQASARRDPEHDAIISGESRMSYGELDRLSSGLAGTLRSWGVRRGDRVGLLLPKGPRSIVGLFGIMRAGGVYVPLDPNAPVSRAAYIIRDCRIGVVLTTARRLTALEEALEDGPSPLHSAVICDGDVPSHGLQRAVGWDDAVADAEVDVAVHGVEADLAYILYTSGSTGVPKGVMIQHRAALQFVRWACESFEVSSSDVVSSHAPLHFDLSIFDIFATVMAGGTIVQVPDRLSTFPVKLTQLIRDHGITVWYSVPSVLILMLTRGKLMEWGAPSLRTVLFAGEVFPAKYLARLRQAISARLYNLYGPTETNVCTYYEVRDFPEGRTTPVPIGRATANYDVFGLHESGRLIRPGEAGELYARGPGIMAGYWGDPAKTDTVLVENPIESPFRELVVRTGDLVTLDDDGEFLFIGRRDHQVKVRGNRVELGEVEATLYAHEDVSEAVVVPVADEDGSTQLKAIVVGRGEGATILGLQAYCAAHLPKYMVPEIIEFRDALPKTSTGKVDRTKLQGEAG